MRCVCRAHMDEQLDGSFEDTREKWRSRMMLTTTPAVDTKEDCSSTHKRLPVGDQWTVSRYSSNNLVKFQKALQFSTSQTMQECMSCDDQVSVRVEELPRFDTCR